jgi:hypothetical protein
MAKRARKSAKKPAKKSGTSKRKPSPDFSPEELEELALIRAEGWDRAVPYDDEDDDDDEIVDPSLGKLRWDVNWQGHVAASAFGKRVPLVVEVFDDYAKPSAAQRTAFDEYRRAEAKVFRAVERMLFDYYQSNKAELRSYKPSIRTANKRLPDLKKPSDIWRIAKVEAIVVPIQEKKGRVVAIDFKAAWDADHGTRAVIQNGVAKRLADPGEG